MDASMEKNREQCRAWRIANRDYKNEYMKAWRKTNRAKFSAHKAVEYAVKVGRLTPKACERCGETQAVHAHHDDYTRPLDVMWLCPKHHKQRHRELKCAEVTQ